MFLYQFTRIVSLKVNNTRLVPSNRTWLLTSLALTLLRTCFQLEVYACLPCSFLAVFSLSAAAETGHRALAPGPDGWLFVGDEAGDPADRKHLNKFSFKESI